MFAEQPRVKSKKMYYLYRITDLLFSSGNSRMKIEDIASSVGVTKKTLYNYFESRKEIVDLVVDNYLQHKRKELLASIDTLLNPIETLVLVAKQYVEILDEASDLIVRRLNYFKDPDLIVLLEKKLELIEIVEYTLRKGVYDQYLQVDVNTKLAAIAYISSVEMLMLRKMSKNPYKVNQTLYLILKGICTTRGIISMRSYLNIEVDTNNL